MACSYKNLANYNGYSAGQLNSPPVPATTTMNVQVVPNYGSIGYAALTGGPDNVPSCNGYFNITSAYGDNAQNCNTQYMQRLCQ